MFGCRTRAISSACTPALARNGVGGASTAEANLALKGRGIRGRARQGEPLHCHAPHLPPSRRPHRRMNHPERSSPQGRPHLQLGGRYARQRCRRRDGSALRRHVGQQVLWPRRRRRRRGIRGGMRRHSRIRHPVSSLWVPVGREMHSPGQAEFIRMFDRCFLSSPRGTWARVPYMATKHLLVPHAVAHPELQSLRLPAPSCSRSGPHQN